ncbi:MAG: leucyl aminopeptidase [Rhizobiaceae bacterium]|nr:leucyl aminopeptidase [Rhizobiaceae bacterium]
MPTLSLSFAKAALPKSGTLVVLVGDDSALPASLSSPSLSRAITLKKFAGKSGSSVDVLGPEGIAADRVILIGAGAASDRDHVNLGGKIAAAFGSDATVTVLAQMGEAVLEPHQAAELAFGVRLRTYAFDKYKTKATRKDEDAAPKAQAVTFAVANAAATKKAFAELDAVADGVVLARDLVNEPANVLGPVEFAAEAQKLEALGVKVTILTEKEMKKLGMGALLGVAQGSVRPARLAIMEWMGGKSKEKPVAFIGKGVVFDTGGVSIKPAAGMEDMKGDMGGAAAVIGVIKALAGRKAKANVVGAIGLVENMVDGNAQRPGDIVISMSGQTIEVLNTDAEGRLVLADVLHHINKAYEPKLMVNLATLTGAIMVALGQSHAGLFSNDDALADGLAKAGTATGEKLWRMPMGSEYDKLIDSKNADMKNIGGRFGGAITAAQFLKRFVGETPWAHLDIAGTAMGSPSSDISSGWASGFGVRLLDRFVRDNHEG